MKKYLFIVLLVGIGIGQNTDDEKHAKVLYPMADNLKNKIEKLMRLMKIISCAYCNY